MSERLPNVVICAACGKPVAADNARRRITLWARLRKGGSLSGIKDQHAEDVFRCDECVRDGRFPEPEPKPERQSLLELLPDRKEVG